MIAFDTGDDHSYYPHRDDGPWGRYVVAVVVVAVVVAVDEGDHGRALAETAQAREHLVAEAGVRIAATAVKKDQ